MSTSSSSLTNTHRRYSPPAADRAPEAETPPSASGATFSDALDGSAPKGSSRILGRRSDCPPPVTSQGQPAGGEEPFSDRKPELATKDRPAINSKKRTSHLNLKWTIRDVDWITDHARNGVSAIEIARRLNKSGKRTRASEIEEICRNAGVIFDGSVSA